MICVGYRFASRAMICPKKLPRNAKLTVNITHQSCALISSNGCVNNCDCFNIRPDRRCGVDIKSTGSDDTASEITDTDPYTAAICNDVCSLTVVPATAPKPAEGGGGAESPQGRLPG